MEIYLVTFYDDDSDYYIAKNMQDLIEALGDKADDAKNIEWIATSANNFSIG